MSKADKIIVVVLIVWSFIHAFLLIKNIDIIKNNVAGTFQFYEHTIKRAPTYYFFPFTKQIYVQLYDTSDGLHHYSYSEGTAWGNFNTDFYDYTEFFVYVVGAWMLFFIYRLLKPRET